MNLVHCSTSADPLVESDPYCLIIGNFKSHENCKQLSISFTIYIIRNQHKYKTRWRNTLNVQIVKLSSIREYRSNQNYRLISDVRYMSNLEESYQVLVTILSFCKGSFCYICFNKLAFYIFLSYRHICKQSKPIYVITKNSDGIHNIITLNLTLKLLQHNNWITTKLQCTKNTELQNVKITNTMFSCINCY